MSELEPTPEPTAEALHLQAQKRRNLWLAWALVGFVVIVGLTTALRIQETDFSSGDRLYFSGYLDEAAVEAKNRKSREAAESALMLPSAEVEETEDDE